MSRLTVLLVLLSVGLSGCGDAEGVVDTWTLDKARLKSIYRTRLDADLPAMSPEEREAAEQRLTARFERIDTGDLDLTVSADGTWRTAVTRPSGEEHTTGGTWRQLGEVFEFRPTTMDGKPIPEVPSDAELLRLRLEGDTLVGVPDAKGNDPMYYFRRK
ncbi:MAG: hypothetical protein QNJ98_06415 [Planctomycetota bacterium]|nr:hypothetical protein [Planctomycetota bacterium]